MAAKKKLAGLWGLKKYLDRNPRQKGRLKRTANRFLKRGSRRTAPAR